MNDKGVALVSGGSRGLGLAMVKSLLDHGYRVATFSRSSRESIERLKEKYRERFNFVEGDMSDQASLVEVVKRVEKDCGPIDALINNAGIAPDGVLATMQPGQIEQVMAVNLTGTLLLTRLVVRQMVVRSRGSIINISSIIGLRGYAGLAAYSATKAGLIGLTQSLAAELAPRRMRVVGVAPALVFTPMMQRHLANGDSSMEENLARMVQVSLVGYAVGGAFLNLAYYDVPYNLLVALVVTRLLVERQLRGADNAASTAAPRKEPEPLRGSEASIR